MHQNLDFSVLDQLAQISCDGEFYLELFRHEITDQIVSVFRDDSIRYYSPEESLKTVLGDLDFPINEISNTEVEFFDSFKNLYCHDIHNKFLESPLSDLITFQMNITLAGEQPPLR